MDLPPLMIASLDFLAAISALAAAFLWWRASGRTVRRVSRFENLDAHDFNRMIVVINRAQILNSRAALAAALAALLAAIRFLLASVGAA
jgi:hypothetical protein